MLTLYSNNCPNCRILKKMLDAAGAEYTECNDVNQMISLGIGSVPVLRVGDLLLQFNDAVAYIQKMEA